MFDAVYFSSISDLEEQLRYLKKCIAEADSSQDWNAAFELRYKYIKQSFFADDKFKALVIFPEVSKLFDDHQDVLSGRTQSFMIIYKWIVEATRDFFVIPMETCMKYFDEFKRRCELYGYSMRTYHMKLMQFFESIDKKKAIEYQHYFRREERDRLSDCEACEMNSDIFMELNYGSEEKAVRMLHDMQRRGISCAEIPECTYGTFIEHFIKKGNIDEAEYYGDLLTGIIDQKNESFLDEFARLILLYTYTDPNAALDMFIRHLPAYLRIKNNRMKFNFADAAARFFEKIAVKNETVFAVLPKTFELYKEDNEYVTAELAKYFKETAAAIAVKFDERNGTSFYKDELEFVYPAEPVNDVSLPAHGKVRSVEFTASVLFKTQEDLPSPDDILKVFVESDILEVTTCGWDENDLIIKCSIKDSDTEARFRIIPHEAPDPESMRTFHYFEREEIESVENEYGFEIAICADLNNDNDDAKEMALLYILEKLNTGGCPVVCDLTNNRYLSSKWLSVQMQSNVPVPDKYLFRIIPYVSEEREDIVDMYTTGMRCFGTRDLMVMNVPRDNYEKVIDILEHIGRTLCKIEDLRDYGEKIQCGIVYDQKRSAELTWRTVKDVYPDRVIEGTEEFAVPMLYLKSSRKEYSLDEIPAEDLEKITFRNYARASNINETRSKDTFPRAAEAFMADSQAKLIVGFDMPAPEDEEINATIYGEVQRKDGELSCIVKDVYETDEIKVDDEVKVNTEKVFYWQLAKDDGLYFYDEAYLL